METKVAVKAIFTQPTAVFSELRSDRKWVPAVVAIVLMLGIHAIVVLFGASSQSGTADLIEVQVPFDLEYRDSEGGASDLPEEETDPTYEEPNIDSTELDASSNQIGAFIIWLFLLLAMLPVGFGFVCLLCLLEAAYFRIVGALLRNEVTLGDWFALCAWSRVPGAALIVVAVTVGLIVLGRQPDEADLDFLRLTRWIDLPEVRHEGESWSIGANFDHLEAYLIWVIALQTIGFKAWTGKSALFSLGIVILPLVILIVSAFAVISLV